MTSSHFHGRLLFITLSVFLSAPLFVSAATTASLVPTAAGTYSEWSPSTGSTHYTLVDESACNGTTDYVATSTTAKRDSYGIALSSIPDNAVITAIAVTPCASRATTGSGSTVLNAFYRYNGANSSDRGSYAPSGTTPTVLATSTWSSLSLAKTSTSTLEIGMVYTSGTKGGRLSQITTQLTYGLVPSATTSAASSITTTSALLNGSANPNGTTTTAWFRIATSSPGTCNDTFGTRVPLSGSTALGAGTSSSAYATTTGTLLSGTTYYYCAIAQNGYGKGYGAVQSFTTSVAASAPSATTSAATSITTSSALLNGTANPNGSSTTGWFRIATSSPGTCNDTFGTRVPLSGGTSLGSGTSSTAYSTTTTALAESTTYYYCAIAQNGYGTSTGSVQSFTTNASLTNVTSSITATTTWTTAGGVYLIDGAISVASGVTLTINAGVVVKFKTAMSLLSIDGTLNAQGSSGSQVYFTSYRDDAVGGDTNGDATSTTPAGGNWNTIKTNSTGSTTLKYSIVRYAGYDGCCYGSSASVYNNGGTITIANSVITLGSTYGISNLLGNTAVTLSTISNQNYGVLVSDGNMNVSSSTIDGNTTYGIYAGGAGTLTMATNTFSNNGTAAGMSFDSGLSMDVHGNSASGTGRKGILLYGTVGVNQTWRGNQLPFIISTVTIGAGKTLTIGHSAVIKFDTATSKITVNGVLIADSSATSSKIYFTSIRDDVAGGDTNGDGNNTSPAAGNWDTVQTSSTGSTTLKNAIIRYGGFSGCCWGSGVELYNTGGAVLVHNTEIGTGTSYGILNSSGTTTVLASEIHDFTYGLCVTGGSANIASSNIHNNSGYGMCNSTGTSLHAEYNYWGNASGPYHSTLNASGTGDHVSIDIGFIPWLTEVHYVWIESSQFVTAVDNSKEIDWNGTTTYPTAWASAVDLWNVLGQVSIGPTGTFEATDLTVEDLPSDPAEPVGWFDPNTRKLYVNAYYMDQYDDNWKLNAFAHELGHALGLYHSYVGNMMNAYATGTTTLGYQDVLDYNYCWIGNTDNNCHI